MKVKGSARLDHVQEYYFSKKLKEIADLEREGRKILNLGIGSPDLPAPDSVINTLQKEASASIANRYQSYRGLPEFRNAIAGFYDRFYGIRPHPEHEVLPLMGSKEGIMHISMAFLNEGDEVLVPDPGYPAYAVCTKLAGGTPKYYHLSSSNNWQPDWNQIESMSLDKVKMMWMNYPHMPSGSKPTGETFEKAVKFGREKGILICHDNPYSFIGNDDPKSLMSVKGSAEVCIELNSLSKTFNMAGWRVGMMIAHRDYISKVLQFKSNMDSGMYYAIQKAAIEALRQPPEWFAELNQIYGRRRVLANELCDLMACTYRRGQAGMFVWAEVPDSFQDGQEMSDFLLRQAGVFIPPGGIFGSAGNRYIRISLCSPSSVFEEAMNRIQHALTKIAEA